MCFIFPGVFTKEKGSLSFLKVLYPDGNMDIWKNYRNQIPANFINAIDEKQAVLSQGLYDLKASPTIYLLDKDKK